MKARFFIRLFVFTLLFIFFVVPLNSYAQRGKAVVTAVEKFIPKAKSLTAPASKATRTLEREAAATENMGRVQSLPTTARPTGSMQNGVRSATVASQRTSLLPRNNTGNASSVDNRSAIVFSRLAAEAARKKKEEEENRKKWLWGGGIALLLGAGYWLFKE